MPWLMHGQAATSTWKRTRLGGGPPAFSRPRRAKQLQRRQVYRRFFWSSATDSPFRHELEYDPQLLQVTLESLQDILTRHQYLYNLT